MRRGLPDGVVLLERMPSSFSASDTLYVFPKRDKIFAMTLPGKVRSYLATGLRRLGMLEGEGSHPIKESVTSIVSPLAHNNRGPRRDDIHPARRRGRRHASLRSRRT